MLKCYLLICYDQKVKKTAKPKNIIDLENDCIYTFDFIDVKGNKMVNIEILDFEQAGQKFC